MRGCHQSFPTQSLAAFSFGVNIRFVLSMPISKMSKISFHSLLIQYRHGTKWFSAPSRNSVPPKSSVMRLCA